MTTAAVHPQHANTLACPAALGMQQLHSHRMRGHSHFAQMPGSDSPLLAGPIVGLVVAAPMLDSSHMPGVLFVCRSVTS